MTAMFKKAIGDLRTERGRSVSIVAALAIGIAGFLAVLSAYAVLTRALNDGYVATNPPAATLAIDDLDESAVETARATPGVADVDARRTTAARIRVGPAQWKNMNLFVRRDFAASRIATVALEQGTWPARADELAIERDALQVAGAKVGDVVTVRAENGQERTMRVVASLHDVGQAQARMENLVYGYVTMDALAALGVAARYDELAISVSEHGNDEVHIVKVANAVKSALESKGLRVARVDVPEPGQHPHAKLMGGLMLSLAVFGAFILALSGVLVFNVLTALLAAQVRQIGVMKALGGSRLQIASIYLFQAALLGVVSVLVALPIGVVGGRALCDSMARFLNFDIRTYALPPWVYALALLVGVAVPLAAALLPVWRGTRVPVRVALAQSGATGRTFGTSALDRALATFSGNRRVLLLAIRNVTRNRVRVALTLATLAMGGIFFMSALNVRQSLVATIDRLFQASHSDLSLTLDTRYDVAAIERAAKRTEGVANAEGWMIVGGHLDGEGRESKRSRFSVIALPAQSTMVSFDLKLGAVPGIGSPDVVVNTGLWERLGQPAVGETVELWVDEKHERFRVAGVAREPFAPAALYLWRERLDERGGGPMANALRISLTQTTPAHLDAAKVRLEETLAADGVRVVQAATKADTRYSFDQHMEMIYVFLVIVSGILACVGTLGLLTTVSLNVTERRRELGVLRAIGATPGRVAQLVVAEGVLVGALAWLLAAAIVLPATKVIGDFILRRLLMSGAEINMAFEPIGLAVWLGVAIAGSALASYLPARQAARLSTREALAFE